jgi:hypothetical protein
MDMGWVCQSKTGLWYTDVIVAGSGGEALEE